MKDSADLPRFEHLTLGGNTPDERHRVALHAVLAADTVPERKHLLDVLGLLATLPRTHGLDGWREGCVCKRCRRADTRHEMKASVPTPTTTDCPINTRREAT